MLILVQIVQFVFWLITLAVIVDVFLGYFVSPYNSLRMTLDHLVNPLLLPIRRIIPAIGGIDFSPFILLILLQLLEQVIISLLLMIR